jgi:hypothetical protein
VKAGGAKLLEPKAYGAIGSQLPKHESTFYNPIALAWGFLFNGILSSSSSFILQRIK